MADAQLTCCLPWGKKKKKNQSQGYVTLSECVCVPLGGAGVEGGAWPMDGRVVLTY